MNHFGKNARKLIRFENNLAEVDFLHCKNGHRDPAEFRRAILASGGKTNRFEKNRTKVYVLKIIVRKLIFYTVKMDIAIWRRSWRAAAI